MNLFLLILVPFAIGALSYFIRSNAVRRTLWLLVALFHLGFSAATVLFGWGINPDGGWLMLDDLGRIFLPITSLLFTASTIWGISSFASSASHGDRESTHDVMVIQTRPEAVFTGCMLLFLASMTCVIVSRKLGLQWVSMEATTLAGTPLVYYHRDKRSLEAAWKFILLCSVGIAVALLGVFSLALASAGFVTDLTVKDLVHNAAKLDPRWLKLAFVFILVGYGAKMGLAPLHTWLPDAHSEAPSPVSALLSGALLNCAFLGILRMLQILSGANLLPFGQNLLLIFGLISMGMAGVFILRQPDYKRMLAYSSVEHMGIITLGVGLGGAGAFGSLLHAVNHSFVKAALFLTAGNILAVYGTKIVRDVRGISKLYPLIGVLWLGGFLAVTGSPPFGTFISELTILKSALDQGRFGVAALYLAFLSLVFIAMATVFIRMTLGAKAPAVERKPIGAGLWAPPLAFLSLALVLGLYIPEPLSALLKSAATLIGGAR